jgi:hypothetical protein
MHANGHQWSSVAAASFGARRSAKGRARRGELDAAFEGSRIPGSTGARSQTAYRNLLAVQQRIDNHAPDFEKH